MRVLQSSFILLLGLLHPILSADPHKVPQTNNVKSPTEPLALHARSIGPRSPMMPGQHYKDLPFSVSHKDHKVAGIHVTVYGLEELQKHDEEIAVVWLLHGRGDKRQGMNVFAHDAITHWNRQRRMAMGARGRGLLAVSFDQRNHGPREVDPMMTQDWNHGNPNHAEDMIKIYRRYSRAVPIA